MLPDVPLRLQLSAWLIENVLQMARWSWPTCCMSMVWTHFGALLLLSADYLDLRFSVCLTCWPLGLGLPPEDDAPRTKGSLATIPQGIATVTRRCSQADIPPALQLKHPQGAVDLLSRSQATTPSAPFERLTRCSDWYQADNCY